MSHERLPQVRIVWVFISCNYYSIIFENLLAGEDNRWHRVFAQFSEIQVARDQQGPLAAVNNDQSGCDLTKC